MTEHDNPLLTLRDLLAVLDEVDDKRFAYLNHPARSKADKAKKEELFDAYHQACSRFDGIKLRAESILAINNISI